MFLLHWLGQTAQGRLFECEVLQMSQLPLKGCDRNSSPPAAKRSLNVADKSLPDNETVWIEN